VEVSIELLCFDLTFCVSIPTMAATENDPNAIAKAEGLSNIPWCEDYKKMISGQLHATPHLFFRQEELSHT